MIYNSDDDLDENAVDCIDELEERIVKLEQQNKRWSFMRKEIITMQKDTRTLY